MRYSELVETYSGDAPARPWAESFQEVLDTAGWDNATSLLVAQRKLTGKAKQWYTLRRPFATPAEFLQRLQEQYPVPPVGDAVAELRRCKIAPGESVRDYAVRFEALAQYADMPESYKLQVFCNAGLPPHIGAAVFHTRPLTLAAAITQAIQAETFASSIADPGPFVAAGGQYGDPFAPGPSQFQNDGA